MLRAPSRPRPGRPVRRTRGSRIAGPRAARAARAARVLRLLAAAGLLALAGPRTLPAQTPPPAAEPGTHVDVLHGVRVPDPFRWMEEMESERVRAWAGAQDARARRFAAGAPGRDRLRDRIAAAADHDRYLSPEPRGDRYFFGRVNSSFTRVELVVQDGLGGEPRTVVDPDVWDARGKAVDRSFWPSPDGRLLAYGVSDPGSDWLEVRFVEVDTGRELPDVLRGLRGRRASAVSWAADGSGVWYDGFEPPAPDERLSAALRGSRVAWHRLGADPADDRIVARARSDDEALAHDVTDDGRWLVVRARAGADPGNRVSVLDLERPGSEVRPLVATADAPFSLVGSRGGELWLYTTAGAPNGRVVGIRADDPDPSRWRVVVPERGDPVDTWTGMRAVGGGIVGGYRRDGLLELRLFDPDGGAAGADGTLLPLPRPGSVWFGFTGRQGRSDFFYVLSGFADPGTVQRHDLATGRTTVFRAPELPYDPADIVTRQVFWRGPAGDRIPMYLAHHRDVTPGPDAPLMMYGYGFGGWSASPWFRAHMGAWLRMGGVFALPALRGGGEFGEGWMRAGLRENRQNTIDDFVAAAEWLVEEGLAAPERLVAETNSAGGPVVAAAILQRPELFGAAILGFPLVDVLRYDAFTGGARWRSQLGTAEDPDEFRALLAYAPVQNVAAGRCPPPLFVAPGERDEVTPPFHAYKLVAALRDAGCDGPTLLRVARGAGHAYGRDQAATVEAFADQLAFLARVLPGWEGAAAGR